jgi:hypothetical protein
VFPRAWTGQGHTPTVNKDHGTFFTKADDTERHGRGTLRIVLKEEIEYARRMTAKVSSVELTCKAGLVERDAGEIGVN